jgi:hypothetical protein
VAILRRKVFIAFFFVKYKTIYRLSYMSLTFRFLNVNNETYQARTLRERDHWGDPNVDGMIILRGIFRNWEGIVGTGWSGLRIGTGGGHL